MRTHSTWTLTVYTPKIHQLIEYKSLSPLHLLLLQGLYLQHFQHLELKDPHFHLPVLIGNLKLTRATSAALGISGYIRGKMSRYRWVQWSGSCSYLLLIYLLEDRGRTEDHAQCYISLHYLYHQVGREYSALKSVPLDPSELLIRQQLLSTGTRNSSPCVPTWSFCIRLL